MKAQSQDTETDEEKLLEREIRIFEQSRTDLSRFYPAGGAFSKDMYWIAHRDIIPTHYAVYLGDCASKKPASANVETVFSGAKKFSDDAILASDSLLGAYVENHINWTYPWLRPHVHDIVCAYISIHGPEMDAGDVPSDADDNEDGEGDGGGSAG